ncbi:MAG TPA: ribbon-helix-helix domain-containing protein [Methanocorpusculum sp.]|nr:ribbon-helix-helix domain-containing protein [Methanocorpusculum sp.]HJK80839.1 ribbon-helix-helix domain-containing protein [Methanocorpusculum sp.]
MTESAPGTNDVFVNVRMSPDLVEKLDLIKKRRKTNRTKEVIRAVEFLVDAIECPRCGTLNSEKSVVCSVCQTNLIEYKESLYWHFVEELRDAVAKNQSVADNIDLVICRHPERGFSIAVVENFETEQQDTIGWITISKGMLDNMIRGILPSELPKIEYRNKSGINPAQSDNK